MGQKLIANSYLPSSLYAYIPSGCKGTCLKLVIRGQELCEYDYQYVMQSDADSFQTKVGQRKARKDLLRTQIKLTEHQGLDHNTMHIEI